MSVPTVKVKKRIAPMLVGAIGQNNVVAPAHAVVSSAEQMASNKILQAQAPPVMDTPIKRGRKASYDEYLDIKYATPPVKKARTRLKGAIAKVSTPKVNPQNRVPGNWVKGNGRNAWIEHVRKCAKANNIPYACALATPQCLASYKKAVSMKVPHKKDSYCESCKSGGKCTCEKKSKSKTVQKGPQTEAQWKAHEQKMLMKYGSGATTMEGLKQVRANKFEDMLTRLAKLDEDEKFKKVVF